MYPWICSIFSRALSITCKSVLTDSSEKAAISFVAYIEIPPDCPETCKGYRGAVKPGTTQTILDGRDSSFGATVNDITLGQQYYFGKRNTNLSTVFSSPTQNNSTTNIISNPNNEFQDDLT